MKVPFSYRHHFFKPLLLTSFIGHALFLGTGRFILSSPQFAVEQAPSSMEIVFVKPDPPRPEKIKSVKVFSTEDPQTQEEVLQKKREERQEKKIPETLVSPPQKGALQKIRPRYLKNPAPLYPSLARERGWEGLVVLKVWVGRDGVPVDLGVERSSGYRILDDAALKAVRNWRFLPVRVGSLSFSSLVRIPIRFLLVEEA